MKLQAKSNRHSAIVKIGLSRQVAIPKKLHDKLGLSPGDYLRVELEGDRLVLTPQALIERRLAESAWMTSELAASKGLSRLRGS
jgi:AbrB family looped-hinge helix DNA binding protein